MSFRAGDDVGGFILEKLVSASASNEVWLAKGKRGDGIVKVLREQAKTNDDARVRLLREAELGESLSSAYVSRQIARGEVRGLPFLVLEKLDGKTLAEVLDAESPLPLERALGIAFDVFSGLRDVHAAGIVHRDVKPPNLFVTSTGETKLIDFGVARKGRGRDLTTNGTTLGSLSYAAPEQLKDGGANVDFRADLYAAGVVLFEMIAGRTPFRAPSPPAVMAMKLSAKAPSLRDVTGKRFPVALEALLASLLARDPARRPTNAELVLATLRVLAP